MPLGELERTVMDRLWTTPDGLSAAALREALPDRGLALTTVHTVLSRLEAKGFVAHDDARPRVFRAVGTREGHAAEAMHEVLGEAADRQAVLARFVSTVDPEEARLLRQLLDEAGA